jgi:CRP/FNR family cyclic AMP-dependent transcriptional regulator
MENLESILAEHPFFHGLRPDHLNLLVGCASNVRFDAGKYILREGEEANQFFLIRFGRVALELGTPNKGPVIIETLDQGEILGWSWLIPPYTWHFDARALELTRAIALDGKCLRKKIEADHELGYVVMKRFSELMVQRFQVTRLQLLDMYGNRD